MTTLNAIALDDWIRDDFIKINTELENIYNSHGNPQDISNIGDQLKTQLAEQGGSLIEALWHEGNTDEGFDQGFDLLGNVGFFMAACRRHEIDTINTPSLSSSLKSASALALQLGASLGVVPRFASAHLETHNKAIDGRYKSFTSLTDEKLFIEYNTRAVFSFIRASDALRHALGLGVSHPIVFDLLCTAKAALNEVTSNNEQLFDNLDTHQFFYHVRPYYKPHTVGLREYRGANAGDFSGINVIDLLLGLCRADDPYYSQLLVDKFLFMRPDDQLVLRDCMRRRSLMDSFLDSKHQGHTTQDWYQKNLNIFIEVCEAHGQTALHHHHKLIKKFIETPADEADLNNQSDLTASGPPLPIMLRGLKRLCDLRSAANVENIGSRYSDLEDLKNSLHIH